MDARTGQGVRRRIKHGGRSDESKQAEETVQGPGMPGTDIGEVLRPARAPGEEGQGERGYGGSWDAARAMFMRSNPLCHDCGRAATLVHHVVPISEGGPRLDMDGLMSLCVPCHGRRHGARAEG
jgi:hypothetical protein